MKSSAAPWWTGYFKGSSMTSSERFMPNFAPYELTERNRDWTVESRRMSLRRATFSGVKNFAEEAGSAR